MGHSFSKLAGEAPEPIPKLEDIEDQYSPPSQMWHKTFYGLLFFCSLLPLASHSFVFSELDWESLRMAHGLLPVEAVVLRGNPPALLPLLPCVCFVLSYSFKPFRSSGFLAWLALIMFFLTTLYVWLSGMITWNLAMRLTLYK
jgi:hypothetical protein